MLEINFINKETGKELCSYDSFVSMEELGETCNLHIYEDGVKTVRVDIIKDNKLIAQFEKDKDSDMKKISC